MADAKIFSDGMIVKAPREGAPEFVKGTLSFRTQEFVHWLENNTNSEGWCNVDLLVGKSGKWYGSKNTFQRSESATEKTVEIDQDSSPF